MANHPAGVMCAEACRVSFSSGAMPAAAVSPVLGISVLAWVMIGLPIILVLSAAVSYLIRPRRSTEEVERAEQASSAEAPRSYDPTGRDRLPGE